jgi:hypothetical protein
MKLFSQVTRTDLRNDFGVSIVGGSFLPKIEESIVPSWLTHVIENRRFSLATMRTEKAISEALIAPILMAVEEKYRDSITVFSGEPLVTEELTGICDFLITRVPIAIDPQDGYLVLVEAKKNDLLSGIPQCVAEMYAAQQLNQTTDTVYGCVSTGLEWLFIKLENNIATTDPNVFTISEVNKILGVFDWIITGK